MLLRTTTPSPEGAPNHSPTMAPMTLKVMGAPDLSVVDAQTLEKIKSLVGAPPAVLRFAGKAARIPSEVIDQLIEETTQPQPGAAGGGSSPAGAIGAGAMPPAGPPVGAQGGS